MQKRYVRIVALAMAAGTGGMVPIVASAELSADVASAANVPSSEDPLSGREIQEIVVTARKQRESLLDVPVAVTTLDQATLKAGAVTTLTAISTLVPDLIIARVDSPGGATINIRGVGASSIDSGIEQSVSVAIDGVQTTRGDAISTGAFDLASVEVLKGPQALYFGKNASAGVVSITSNGPTKSVESYARAGYEFHSDRRFFEGAISGPLTDNLQARFALRLAHDHGYTTVVPAVQNPLIPDTFATSTGPDSQDVREAAGRLSVNYEPSDSFTMRLKSFISRYQDNGPKSFEESYCSHPLVHGTTFGVTDPNSDCLVNLRDSHGNWSPDLALNWPDARGGRSYTDSRVSLSSFEMEYDTDLYNVVSTTGYLWMNYKVGDTGEHTSFRSLPFITREDDRDWSQELRATTKFSGPVNVVFGGYADGFVRNNPADVMVFYTGLDPVTNTYYNVSARRHDTGNSYSGFGQLRWDVLKELQLAAGARYMSETKKTDQWNSYVSPTAGPALSLRPQDSHIRAKDRENNWSPEATVTWKPLDRTMFYAAYKTGYKSGGFSNPAILTSIFDAQNVRVSGEKATGFEIGTKTELFDRSLLLQVIAFDYKYSNLQVQSFDAATVSFVVSNAAVLRTEGVETSVQWRATRNLTLNAVLAYDQAKFIDYTTAACYAGQAVGPGNCNNGLQDLSGEPPPRAPEWVASTGFAYDRSVTDRLSVGINGAVKYSSSYETQDNNNPGAIQKSYVLLDAGVRLYTNDNRYELALIGRNLTDRLYILSSTDKATAGPGEFQGTVAPPREMILQGTVRF